MPENDERPKVVHLNPKRFGEEFITDHAAHALELAKQVVELCEENDIDGMIVIMTTKDGRRMERYIEMQRQSILWLLETTKLGLVNDWFAEEDAPL